MVNKAGKTAVAETTTTETEKTERKKTTPLDRARAANEKAQATLAKAKEKKAKHDEKAGQLNEDVRVAEIQARYTSSHPLLAEEAHAANQAAAQPEVVSDVPEPAQVVAPEPDDEPETDGAPTPVTPDQFDFDMPGDPDETPQVGVFPGQA